MVAPAVLNVLSSVQRQETTKSSDVLADNALYQYSADSSE
jgi:hypothetical protein